MIENVYRVIIDEKSVVQAIAFVKEPAIVHPFSFENEKKADTQLNFLYEKNIITSPLLLPNQMIYRRDTDSNGKEKEYYLYYTDVDVMNCANYIINNSKKIKFNIEHDENRIVEGVEFVGVGVTDDVMLYLSFFDLPKNTLFVQLQVNNDELLQMIQNGEVRGLSIEGEFTMIPDDNAFIDYLAKQSGLDKIYNRKITNKNFKL